MERVERIEGAVFDAIAAAGPAAWAQGTPRQRLGLELRQATVAGEASDEAVEQLRALVPPEAYRRAHALLIEYNRVGSRFSAIEADVVRSQLRGRPDANAEEELRQVGEQLMGIAEELSRTPPFLRQPLPVEVRTSPGFNGDSAGSKV
jgi:hypothetical protein